MITTTLFNFCNWLDEDTTLDLSCDVAMDNGFGYCKDCGKSEQK
jgi:hypothetical protein